MRAIKLAVVNLAGTIVHDPTQSTDAEVKSLVSWRRSGLCSNFRSNGIPHLRS